MKSARNVEGRIVSPFAVVALMLALSLGALPARGQGFTFTDFSATPANANLAVNGSAATQVNGNVLRLVPDTSPNGPALIGTAWYKTQQPVLGGFKTIFTFQITHNGTPADGLAFVIQNDANATAASGGGGGDIGYGSNNVPGQMMSNSLAVEFDTFNDGAGDPDANHIAFQNCGSGQNSSSENATYVSNNIPVPCNLGVTQAGALASDGLTLTDGNPHTVEIDYQPNANCGVGGIGTLNVNLLTNNRTTSMLLLSACNVNLASRMNLASGVAYVGFTASTGQYYENDDILDWEFAPTTLTIPITSTNGTTPTTVVFNGAANQLVRHGLVFPTAVTEPITNPILSVTNTLISSSVGFQPYTSGGPFAIATPFIHNGDNVVGAGTDFGSMYEDQCYNMTDTPTPAEANCPYPSSSVDHIFSRDIFDISNKPPIAFGTTASFVHYYPNTVPAITSWLPSSTSPNPVCTSVTNSANNTPAFTCDIHDVLVNLFGDQICHCGRDGKKGTFIGVYNVPMPLSTVRVNGTPVNSPGTQVDMSSSRWFRSPLTFDFVVAPAQLPPAFSPRGFTGIERTSGTVTVTMSNVPPAWVNGTLLSVNPDDSTDFPAISTFISSVTATTFQYTQAGADVAGNPSTGTANNSNGWIAGPVASLFETFNLLSSMPPSLPDIPDTTCPADSSCTVTSGTPGASSTANVEFTSTSTPSDGQYLLQWSAADTVGIRERLVQLLPVGSLTPCPNPGALFSPAPTPPCYSTTLFGAQINVDSTPPTSTTALNPPGGFYAQNSGANAVVTCSDPTNLSVFSGIAQCGSQGSPQAFNGQQTVSTSNIPLVTTTLGPQTFVAYAQDEAGNSSAMPTNYVVVGPADLAIAMIASPIVATGRNLTYFIGVANRGPNAAELVTVNDLLPAGTSLVSAGFTLDSCVFFFGIPICPYQNPTSNCSSNGASVSCFIGALAAGGGYNGAIIQIVVKVTAPVRAKITDTVTVSGANADPNLKNNTASWLTAVTR